MHRAALLMLLTDANAAKLKPRDVLESTTACGRGSIYASAASQHRCSATPLLKLDKSLEISWRAPCLTKCSFALSSANSMPQKPGFNGFQFGTTVFLLPYGFLAVATPWCDSNFAVAEVKAATLWCLSPGFMAGGEIWRVHCGSALAFPLRSVPTVSSNLFKPLQTFKLFKHI